MENYIYFINVHLWTLGIKGRPSVVPLYPYLNTNNGSLGIAPTRICTHFLKIGFVVAGGGLYSYYIHQGNKSDKERKIVRKQLSFMHKKRFNIFSKNRCNFLWVQLHVYHTKNT